MGLWISRFHKTRGIVTSCKSIGFTESTPLREKS
jgi:hypothetical protein